MTAHRPPGGPPASAPGWVPDRTGAHADRRGDRHADALLRAYRALAAALGVPAWRDDLVEELAITCGWGRRSLTDARLPSGVSHGLPWGVSCAAQAGAATLAPAELRVFVEAQADPPSPRAYWEAAARVTALATAHGAHTARLEALLATGSPECGHRVWHALSVTGPRAARWHAYLCLPPRDEEATRAALAAVGIVELPRRAQDRVTIVSLDLLAATPRVKAYVLLPDLAPDELEPIAARATGAVPGDARRFARAMLGADRPIWWLAAFGFTPGEPRPHTCALHFGVPRHVDEPQLRARLAGHLADLGLPVEPWRRAAGALGAHHFVTFQRTPAGPRVTTYFLPPGPTLIG